MYNFTTVNLTFYLKSFSFSKIIKFVSRISKVVIHENKGTHTNSQNHTLKCKLLLASFTKRSETDICCIMQIVPEQRNICGPEMLLRL